MRFRPWLLVVTVLYLMAVAWMTLRPDVYGHRTSELLWRALDESGRHGSTSWITFSVVESVSNAVMFVPLGFFLALFFPKRLFVLAVGLCALLSYGIETYQGAFLSTRVSDPADVLHNTLGGLVGVLIALVLRLLLLPFASLGRRPAGRASSRRRAAGLVR
ncbi:VanZ like protein [Frondihabitans sp. PhB188]|uniref:VanZ family protein n=1 Tax=Frondihabitans sp. PhB188 TaxID=2485200 RepID=UPI000F47BB8C|nr:VanZ family protein [Frondihabitans sp. PhB188]ROQ38201.1 VanZ like protein [Frondihabitans sp. PhB188]